MYKKHLIKTKIREIKWGIGRNDFFHNCVLIDTPGLSQELRFTNVIEDVKNYEVDGIIWVISSGTLAKKEGVDAYKEALKFVTDRIKNHCESRGGYYMLVPAYANLADIFFGNMVDMGVLK